MKIIAYSLWGDDPKYVSGAYHNANLIGKEFPGWSMRIYYDWSVPDDVITELYQHPQISLVSVEDLGIKYGMFWRYCIADDATVDRFLIRDLDDRLNSHDKAAVDEWVESGKPFHIMRCVPVHNFLVMGGLWGAKPEHIPFNMKETIQKYESMVPPHDKYRDQRFLGEFIYPHARENCVVHGLDFDFNSGDVREFPGSHILGGVYAPDIKTWEEGNA